MILYQTLKQIAYYFFTVLCLVKENVFTWYAIAVRMIHAVQYFFLDTHRFQRRIGYTKSKGIQLILWRISVKFPNTIYLEGFFNILQPKLIHIVFVMISTLTYFICMVGNQYLNMNINLIDHDHLQRIALFLRLMLGKFSRT